MHTLEASVYNIYGYPVSIVVHLKDPHTSTQTKPTLDNILFIEEYDDGGYYKTSKDNRQYYINQL